MPNKKGSKVGFLVALVVGSAGLIIALLIGLIPWNYYSTGKVTQDGTFSTGKLMYEKGHDPEIALLRKELEAQKALTLEEKNKASECEEKRSKSRAWWKEYQRKKKQQPDQGALKQGVITVVKKRPPKVIVVKDLNEFFQQTNERLLDGVQKN